MSDPSSNSPSPQEQPQPRKKAWTHRLRRAVFVYAVVPYLAILVLMTVFQRDLMYHTSREDSLVPDRFGDVGYGHLEDIHIRTHDGLTLNGWILHTEEAGANPDDHYVILSFPGNAGNRGDRAYDCREFAEQGFDVVLVDYRGYGDNPGSPNEDDILADA